MILTEYDEDFNNKTWYEDGIIKGKLEDAENHIKYLRAIFLKEAF